MIININSFNGICRNNVPPFFHQFSTIPKFYMRFCLNYLKLTKYKIVGGRNFLVDSNVSDLI